MGNSPLVSVVIPTYKRLESLKNAINSVLNQTYKNIEIIIVNDDPNIDITKKVIKNKKIRCINHKKNNGGSAARNTGMRKSSGKYIIFLDDDDFWLPLNLERKVKIMEGLSKKWVGVYSLCFRTNSLEDYRNNKIRISKSNCEGNFTFELLSGNKNLYLGGSGLLIRLEKALKINGFDENFERHQDIEFIVRLLKKGKIKLIKDPLWVNVGGCNFSSVKKVEDSKIRLLKKFNDIIKSYGGKRERFIYGYHFLELSQFSAYELDMKKMAKYFWISITYAPPFQPARKYLKVGLFFMKGIKNLL
jgi:glycosyltransferase involved in cell wall biosynthesis